MPSLLYLDAARMGRMAPAAQLALEHFARFSGEQGCTLYFERFLQDGFAAWPRDLKTRYPGLGSWGGVAELKQTIRRELATACDTPVLVASRSTNLTKLAAKLLFRAGKRILITDLTWPSYRRILEREARKARGSIRVLSVRDSILHEHSTPHCIAQRLSEEFIRRGCSGLFIPEVSHQGIRLPVAAITRALRHADEGAKIVIDGSQAFGQIPVSLGNVACDFYIAGCHKWLGATLPLGIGVLGNPATEREIQSCLRALSQRDAFDDPLWAFLHGLESGRPKRFTETVNVSPLFSCRGALEGLRQCDSVSQQFERRRMNAALVRRVAPMTGWNTLGSPAEDFLSGSVLLQVDSGSARMRTPASIREDFHTRKVALTAYVNGIIRLSMPSTPLERLEAGNLIQALALVQVGSSASRSFAIA